jgi:hypothetical protein
MTRASVLRSASAATESLTAAPASEVRLRQSEGCSLRDDGSPVAAALLLLRVAAILD